MREKTLVQGKGQTGNQRRGGFDFQGKRFLHYRLPKRQVQGSCEKGFRLQLFELEQFETRGRFQAGGKVIRKQGQQEHRENLIPGRL